MINLKNKLPKLNSRNNPAAVYLFKVNNGVLVFSLLTLNK